MGNGSSVTGSSVSNMGMKKLAGFEESPVILVGYSLWVWMEGKREAAIDSEAGKVEYAILVSILARLCFVVLIG